MDGSRRLLIKDGLLITMDAQQRVLRADLRIEGDRIAEIGEDLPRWDATVLDAGGDWVLPGWVQTSVRASRSLLRGSWTVPGAGYDPSAAIESAMTPAAAAAAARATAAELVRSGTTTALFCEPACLAPAVLDAVADSPLEVVVGWSWAAPESELPSALTEPFSAMLGAFDAAHHQQTDVPRRHLALAPRCPRSVAPSHWSRIQRAAIERNCRVFLPWTQSANDARTVRRRLRGSLVEAFEDSGLLDVRTIIGHPIHCSRAERDQLVSHSIPLSFAPSRSLRETGRSRICDWAGRGATISLGGDSPFQGGHLDLYRELRGLADRPSEWSAGAALQAATLGGARALGLDAEVGSLEVGKRADLQLLDAKRSQLQWYPDVHEAVLAAARSGDLRLVLAAGEIVASRGHGVDRTEGEVFSAGQREGVALARRLGVTVQAPLAEARRPTLRRPVLR